MSTQYQQAKADATVDTSGGYFEITVHVLDADDTLGWLTVDVWADSDELDEISSGLFDALTHSYDEDNTDYLARKVPAMLRHGLIWSVSCSPFDWIDSPEALRDALDSGEISMMRY